MPATITYTNVGEELLLDVLVTYLNTLDFFLFINDGTPTCEDVDSDYEVCDSVTISPVIWSESVEQVDGSSITQLFASFTFTYTGAGDTVYGIYGLDPGDDTLIIAGEFPSPIVLVTDDTVTITQMDISLYDPKCPPMCGA